MTIFFQIAINGLLVGMIYALITVGLSLIWGVMNVINFAHGDFLMVAMYISYWLGFLVHMDPIISWIASGTFCFILGILTYRLIIRRCLSGPVLSALLATFGLSLVIRNFCLNRFSPNFRLLRKTLLGGKKIVLGGLYLPLPQLVTGIFALVVVFVIYYIIKRTRLGWAIEAVAMDKEAAELMGINTDKIFALLCGMSGACVGIAGGLLPSYLTVYPEVGVLFCFIAFVCVAMGGFGSILGALMAALLVGLVEAFGGFYIAPIFKYVVIFGLYLVVVTFRPKGLFGW